MEQLGLNSDLIIAMVEKETVSLRIPGLVRSSNEDYFMT